MNSKSEIQSKNPSQIVNIGDGLYLHVFHGNYPEENGCIMQILVLMSEKCFSQSFDL